MKLKSDDLGRKTFKFTKQFEFEFNLETLPDDVFDELVGVAFKDLSFMLHPDGSISVYNDWTVNDPAQFSFLRELRSFIECYDPDDRESLKKILLRAIKIIDDAQKEETK